MSQLWITEHKTPTSRGLTAGSSSLGKAMDPAVKPREVGSARAVLCLLLGLCLPFLLYAKEKDGFQVSGVKGKMLTNIQSRLKELEQNHSLSADPDEELKQHIEKSMYPYGYFNPEIRIRRPSGKQMQIDIKAGPLMHIDQLNVDISGEGEADSVIRQALKALPIKQGDPLNSPRYEKAKQSLLDAAEHQGYLHANFTKAEMRIDKQARTSTVTLHLDTGPRYYFGQVKFDPTYISPDVLQRYIPFKPGQPYSEEQVLAFNNTLSGSGYFRQVAIKPDKDKGTYVPVDVTLHRANRINYSLGVGYGTDTGPRGRAGLHIVPVNRSGHKLNIVALGSISENTLQGQYIIPGNKPLVDQLEVLGGISNLHYDSGNSNALTLSLAQRHNTKQFQRVLSLNSLYERFRYTYAPSEDNFSLFPKASLTWLNKSDQLFSPQGYKLTVSGLVANKALLSQTNFAQGSLDARAAIYFDVIRTRLYLHGIMGGTQINNIDQLPLSLAQLLGGADNLKGYSFNSIGPGKIQSYGGFEIQKETFKKWYLLGFFDIGDVYMPSLKSLQRDVGLGLMWVSPVGPIKIGLAQPVDDQFHRLNHSSPRLVINMGPDL